MSHFFERIRLKAQDVSQHPVLIIALGDSVTQGVMEHRFLDSKRVYHRLLQQELEDFFPLTTFSTINAGVSGGTVTQAVQRLERDVLRHAPDLVLIAFGLNDSLGGEMGLSPFQTALREIVRKIRQGTSSDVMLVTPPFMARCKNVRIHPEHEAMADNIIRAQTDGTLGQYAEAIRQIAVEEKTYLADVHREWESLAGDGLDTDVWLVNGLNHPDHRGHKLACSIVLNEILSMRSGDLREMVNAKSAG